MITRHHIQGAGWMLWTFLAGYGAWLLWIAPKPLSMWLILPAFIGGLSAILWGVFHFLALSFWLLSRPNPEAENRP